MNEDLISKVAKAIRLTRNSTWTPDDAVRAAKTIVAAWEVLQAEQANPVTGTKPSIDWSAVHPKFKWMAKDADGWVCVFVEKPKSLTIGEPVWCGAGSFRADAILSSVDPGTCDWRDSLVQRPEENE